MSQFLKKVEVSKVLEVLVHFSDHLDEDGHVAVIRWDNGEGYTVSIASENGTQHFEMTHTQWDALKRAVKTVRKHGKATKV